MYSMFYCGRHFGNETTNQTVSVVHVYRIPKSFTVITIHNEF